MARPELTELHDEEVGHIEGFNHADILRYLRHEMGHVLNYAYKLYDDESWVKLFGSITQHYREDYRPQPFSRRFVRHLPGWYAPETSGRGLGRNLRRVDDAAADWRAEYAQWPSALAKLELCDRLVATFAVREPLVTSTERDDDVAALDYSLREFYKSLPTEPEPGAAGLDGDLRAIFDDLIELAKAPPKTRGPRASSYAG